MSDTSSSVLCDSSDATVILEKNNAMKRTHADWDSTEEVQIQMQNRYLNFCNKQNELFLMLRPQILFRRAVVFFVTVNAIMMTTFLVHICPLDGVRCSTV